MWAKALLECAVSSSINSRPDFCSTSIFINSRTGKGIETSGIMEETDLCLISNIRSTAKC